MAIATSIPEKAEVATEVSYRPGDKEDFDRLYRDSYHRILLTLTGILRDPYAAQDCAQDTFVKAFRAWHKWQPTAPAEAWLHRIALNIAISYRRHQRLREIGEVVRRLGAPPPAPIPGEDDNRIAAMMEGLRRLPRQQAAVVILRHFHGYSNRELGYTLGIPESTVASRLAAARAILRAHISGTVTEPGLGVIHAEESPR